MTPELADRLLRDWLETYGYTTDDIERLKPCPLDLEARTRTYLSSSKSKESPPAPSQEGHAAELASAVPPAGMVIVPQSLIEAAQCVREEFGDSKYGKSLRFKGYVTDKQIALCDALREWQSARERKEKR